MSGAGAGGAVTGMGGATAAGGLFGMGAMKIALIGGGIAGAIVARRALGLINLGVGGRGGHHGAAPGRWGWRPAGGRGGGNADAAEFADSAAGYKRDGNATQHTVAFTNRDGIARGHARHAISDGYAVAAIGDGNGCAPDRSDRDRHCDRDGNAHTFTNGHAHANTNADGDADRNEDTDTNANTRAGDARLWACVGAGGTRRHALPVLPGVRHPPVR